MRVLLISSGLIPTPPEKGGATELYAYKLCEALRELSVEAYIVDRMWESVKEYPWMLRVKVPLPANSNSLTRIFSTYKSSIVKEIFFGLAATKLIKKLKPDIVHANTAWAGYILSCHIKENEAPRFIYTCHNPLWPEEKVHAGEKIVRFFESSAMRKADAVIALNETMKKVLIEKVGIEFSKVFVVPNGVDIEFFKPGLNCEEIKKKYGLEGRQVILFVGRVTPVKGVHVLLEALKIIKEKHGLGNIKALIVGPLSGTYGVDKPSKYVIGLQKYASTNGLDVIFTGAVSNEELRYLYSCSHVLVLPSYFEAFPMVLIEAMASGLPIIGSSAGGIVNIIRDGVNGFLFEKGDPNSLAERLYAVLSDEALCRKLSINGRAIAEIKYSWNRVAFEILKIYESLLR